MIMPTPAQSARQDWRLETGDWRLETGDWRLRSHPLTHRPSPPPRCTVRPSMKKILCVLCATAASYVLLIAAGQDSSPLLKNYKPVTASRLLKPEDGDWLMVRRTYDGWGYSPLEKINTSNV